MTASKKSKKSTAKRRPIWSAEGPDAVQLFRDLYFEKYPVGTRASTIHQDPTRKYSVFNPDGFSRQYRGMIEKLPDFKSFGTGFTDAFIKNARLEEPPPAQDRKADIVRNKSKTNSNSDDKDSDYNDNEEEDSSDKGDEDSLIYDAEVESLLRNIDINCNSNNKIESNGAKLAVSSKMPRISEASGALDVPLLSPQLVNCQGGVLAGYVPLFTGVEYEFSIGDNKKQLTQRMYIPGTYQNATQVFYRHGMTAFNVYIAGVQENMDLQKEKTKVSETNKMFHESVLFNLPYEIEPSFFDEKGNKINKIFEGKGPGGLLWAFFYLKKKKEEDKTPKKTVGFDRENKRDSDENGYAYRNVTRNTSDRFTTFQPNIPAGGYNNGLGANGVTVQQGNATTTVPTSSTLQQLKEVEAKYLLQQQQHQQQQQQLQQQQQQQQQKLILQQEDMAKKKKEAERQHDFYQQQLHQLQAANKFVQTQAKQVEQENLVVKELLYQNTTSREDFRRVSRVNHERIKEMETQLDQFIEHVAGGAQTLEDQNVIEQHVQAMKQQLVDEAKPNMEQEFEFQDLQSRIEYEAHQLERQPGGNQYFFTNTDQIMDCKPPPIVAVMPERARTDEIMQPNSSNRLSRSRHGSAALSTADDESMKTTRTHMSVDEASNSSGARRLS